MDWGIKNSHLFYFPQIGESGNYLDEEESKHCVRVLRQNVGDVIVLMDGRGSFYKASITSANPKKCEFNVIDTYTPAAERNFRLHLAVAPTKNLERFEWFLEKATEMGIDEITPLICKHSERKELKTARLQRILISAMKQSMHAHIPILNECVGYRDFIKTAKDTPVKAIAHCREGEKLPLKAMNTSNSNVLVLIGPEGDFTQQEVEWAIENGFTAVSLGNSRLRTETAAVAACFTINIVNS